MIFVWDPDQSNGAEEDELDEVVELGRVLFPDVRDLEPFASGSIKFTNIITTLNPLLNWFMHIFQTLQIKR